MSKLFSNHGNEKGQGLVEYAIILALVAIVVIAAMGGMGQKLSCTFQQINNSLDGASGACGETTTASQPGLGAAFSSTFTGCSGTCTDTSFTCSPGASFKISYTASSYGGETGSSPHHSCSGGGTAFAGNFWPEQTVTITDEATGVTQTYVVPHP